MIRRMIWPLVFGLGGVAILMSLGIWQVQRLAWKEGVLAEIEARIAATPEALPEAPTRSRALHAGGRRTGEFGDGDVRVLVSQKGGRGRSIASSRPFETGGRRILVDRGFMPTEGAAGARGARHRHRQPALAGRGGRLHARADLARNIWYARDVDALAAHLGTEPVLLIARDLSVSDAPVTPLPVDTSGIPNDHLNYAITWFSLAALWMGMTLYLLWRIRRKPN
jgi:surfeit locus 1 family protein